MSFQRLNRITGAIVFLLSFLGYYVTMAPTVSYWDCGEFAACSYTLGVPHPPGSPLFLIIGRIMTMLPLADISHIFGMAISDYDVAHEVTWISVLAGAFTILFLYLIVVRMLQQWIKPEESFMRGLKIVLSAATGALTFAFTYSHWFNSVESEVYACSIFFTAIVIWLIMIWLEKPDDLHGDAYLLLIAYMIGLAIGVHELNILTLPFIFFIIYCKKYTITFKSFAAFVGLSLLGVLIVFKAIGFWSAEIPNFMDRYGLGTVSVLLMFAVMIYMSYYFIKANKHTAAIVTISILLIFIGYSTYAMIMIRSGMNPNIDQNDPQTWAAFIKYLNREQYGSIEMWPRVAPFWDYQINKMFVRYFNWQFIGRPDEYALSLIDHLRNAIGWTVDRLQDTQEDRHGYMYTVLSFRGLYGIPFLVGLWGLFYHFSKDWKRALANMALFLATGIAVIIYLNQPDPQPRERDYSYTGAFFAFSAWIGIGMYAILEWLEQKIKDQGLLQSVTWAVVGLMFVLLPLNMFIYNFRTSSRQGNLVAWDYSYNLLETCEPNAILFTNGDNDTFPLWYLQEVEKVRPDVSIVNLSLVNTDWYVNIKKNIQLTYTKPDHIVTSYPWKESDPPGYVFKAMKVPISLPDEEILSDPRRPNSGIMPMPWETKTFSRTIPKEVYWKDWVESGNPLPAGWDTMKVPKMTFEVRPTLYNRFLKVQDMMVLDILFSNEWKRPVYFAITVSNDAQTGLQRYLRMDGLAFKVITVPDQQISPKHLYENTFTKYKFRNMDNPDIFYDDNVRRLTQNYRSLYLQLADFFRQRRNYGSRFGNRSADGILPELPNDQQRIIKILDTMEKTIPETVIPMRDYRLKLTTGQFYADAGKPEKLRQYIQEVLENEKIYRVDNNAKIQIAGVYQYALKDADASIAILKPIVDVEPNNGEALGWYIQALEEKKNYAEASSLLERWLSRNPQDVSAKNKLDEYKKKLSSGNKK